MNSNKQYQDSELIKKIFLLKDEKKIIGFTNGCFDLLHKGHISLLIKAKKKCDYLIIGLNDDSSIKSIKGEDRPIDSQNDRIIKLSKLEEVDAIILFSEDNPLNLIIKLCPDILFKGADYKEKKVVGSDFIIKSGGKVTLIDLLDGYSTTKIINNSSN
jgi:rfaE bifunctional protein nucleotidyltransferase chain/domain